MRNIKTEHTIIQVLRTGCADLILSADRGEICQCRHCRCQCKIFNSGVNFSRNKAIYNINESIKYILISSLKLLTD